MMKFARSALDGSKHGGVGGGGGEQQPQTTFAMQVLMEECATLKKRVKELEEKNDGTDGSGKTIDMDFDATEHVEIAKLRKDLNQGENERATMELDFMNQLSQIARDGAQQVEEVQKKLTTTEKELALQQNKSSSSRDAAAPDDGRDEVQQLRDDLASADSELKVNRRDVEDMHKKVTKLEVQKSALIDEVTSVRMEVDNESKTIVSLNSAMEENDKHFASRIEKLEQEVAQRNTIISKKDDEVSAMNSRVVKFEGQKSMLLEEITDLRMQLDRNDESKKALKKKVAELEQAISGEEESARMGSLKQAASESEEKVEELQEKVNDLEQEVRSVTKSYKADVLRLEDAVNKREMESEQVRKQATKTEEEIKELVDENAALVLESQDLKLQREEAKRATVKVEQEVSSLNSQRISYEKRSTHCIMEHLADADDAMDKVSSLEIQVKTLEVTVAQEKTKNLKLKTEMDDIKARPVTAKKSFPPPVAPPSPSRSYNQNRSESPSWASNNRPTSPSWTTKKRPSPVVGSNKVLQSSSVPNSPSRGPGSVRALAACFESNPALLETDTDPVPPVEMTSPSNYNRAINDSFARGPDMESLQNQVAHLENELEAATSLNELLQQKLQKQCEQVGELQAEVATMTATRAAIQALSRKDYDVESQKAKTIIEKLESELAAARKQLEAETAQIKGLKDEIRSMTSERLAYEECTMEAYEKRAVTGQKTHQSELNNLKVELTKSQMKIADLRKEHTHQVKDFEQTIEDLNMECDKEIEEKQGELDMIKFKLDEQQDNADQLQHEREQLCVQMNTMSNNRRGDLEEIQSDLMERTTENMSLKRALQSLQMQVEHQTDNSRELEVLRVEVKKLEARAGPTGTALHKQGFEVEKLAGENKKLRDQVRNITTERRGLQERLNAVVTEQNTNRSVHIMRDRNEKLKREVERLTQKLAKAEGGVNRFAI
mmetsp:Transcript_5975/g.9976  ORF Transcript_5975/g.9976 Transcript_5975/m.9976 type:complete len:951 (-) Transcript_5975:110-2962(-)|eukprot:CAMPEP_0119016310 /NCGR_PEP_ID=MMETSP1176-20130426/11997_1 /TAXON_ID=265551 /ORGANISM="Synedropsis recta cf, Strain CCMP1620" /LENGTH=950 /DNA_ID=CAMNT_0006969659 /DNA_START=83 /DNA_END=2935 /DNA_ORIENTATION=+